jgi:hypothetical protein
MATGAHGLGGRTPRSASREPADRVNPATFRDAIAWLALVGAGTAMTMVAVSVHARLGSRSAPFIGSFAVRLGPATLAAGGVALAIGLAIRRGLFERLPFRWLLAGSYLGAVAWSIGLALIDGRAGLARPLTGPESYLSDVSSVGTPAGFLRHFGAAASRYSVETRQHPPAPVLLLWALNRLGVTGAAQLGVVLTLIGCLTVPLIATAVRSLCGPASARRLLPVLVLAPYAVWVAVSLDAVTMTLCAGAVTCGVVASEPGRSGWWGAAGGLLLGLAALFSYSAGWLGVSVILVYFVRRRPLLNVVTGTAALIPLALVRIAGFVWTDGLTAAQADFSRRIGPNRSWLLWVGLDLFVLLLAAGPAIIPAARKLRRTPGWPFLVGAGLAVAFALLSGLSRGEVERSWLPFYPWLLVAAIAPERRPTPAEPGAADSAPTPVLLVSGGALTAIMIETVVRTAW